MMNHDVSQSEAAANQTADVMLSVGEICQRLGISRPTFHRLVNRGELPVMRVGERWKMSQRTLREYMDGKRGTGKSE